MRNQEQGNNTMSEMLNQEKLTMGSYTQVENVVIDKLMALLGDVEFRVFMAIYRKTIGWGKLSDTISTSQLMQITGKSNRAVIDAVEFLNNNGLISTENSVRNSKKFTINLSVINNSNTYEKLSLVKKVHKSHVKKVHSTCENSSQVTCENSSHTKETINKLTKESGCAAEKCESQNSHPKKNHIPNLNLPNQEKITAIEIFEYLKNSWAFGNPILGEVSNRKANLDEITILAIETANYWNSKTKHLGVVLSKQELLEKIYSSATNLKRMTAAQRLERYTLVNSVPQQTQASDIIPNGFNVPLPTKTDPKVLEMIAAKRKGGSHGIV